MKMCLARFDDDTREAFMSLYGKVDAEFNAEDEPVQVDTDGTKCPF